MKRLLITDDNRDLRKLVKIYAELRGFECHEAGNGSEALALINEIEFDILVLDIMMPEMDGYKALTEMRKHSQIPVIVLTSRSEDYDKQLGFHLGADDYMLKPFSPKELMARVNAVLRRSTGQTEEQLQFGGFYIEPASRMVKIDGREVDLPPKEFALLLALSRNAHTVMSREQLLQRVWGFDYDGDVHTIDNHIRVLRKQLGKYRNLIKTIWGVGYKFEYQPPFT